jgi:hypothetical protein
VQYRKRSHEPMIKINIKNESIANVGRFNIALSILQNKNFKVHQKLSTIFGAKILFSMTVPTTNSAVLLQ